MEEEEMASQSQEPERRSTAVVENIQPLPETRDLMREENTQMLQDTQASKEACVMEVPQVSLSQHHTEGSDNLSICQPSQCTINILQLKPETTADRDRSAQGGHLTKDPALAAADRCRKALRIHYRSTGSYVQLIPWEDDDTKHIKDIYTDLTLIKTRNKLGSYNDIFSETRERDPIKRVVLNGLPGKGKSTLMDKMAYDWACNEELQQFNLVFVLRMSAVEQSTELMDSIFAQLLDEDADLDKDALSSYISQNEENVLILLDGFDLLETSALDKTEFGSILKILNRKKGRDLYVVVTTRPSHYDKLVTKQLVQEPFTQVRVEGFDKDDIRTYVYRFYSEEHDKAKGLLQKIESSDNLSDLANSPMLLLLICILWRDNSTLPETMSRIYSEALVYIFRRRTDMTAEEISKVTNKLGKIVLHGLLAKKQLLTFSEEVFETSVLESAIKAGILTKQKVLMGTKSHNSIQFLHKTFQELCAGGYLQSLFETDTVKFKKTLNEMIKSEGNDFEYVLRFCAGDNMACTKSILQTLLETPQFKVQAYQGNDYLLKIGLNCYFEGQSKDLPPMEFIESVLSERIFLFQWNSDSLNSLISFLQIVCSHTINNKQANDLDKVKSIVIFYCDLGGCISELVYFMSLMGSLSSVILSGCSLNVRGEEYDASSRVASCVGGSAELWARHLKKMKNLQKLILCNCSMTGKDMTHISPALCDLPKLVELNFEGNQALGGSAASCAYHFKKMKNLQKVNLSNCSSTDRLLAGEGLTHIVHALCDLPDLVELNLDGNEALGGTAASLSQYFKKMTNLHKLELCNCSLTGEGMIHIAPALCNLPNLVELIIEGNETLGGSAASWSHYFKKMKNLQKLDMRHCFLTGIDKTHITTALRDLPHCKWLK